MKVHCINIVLKPFAFIRGIFLRFMTSNRTIGK